MISHTTLGVSDFQAALLFYSAVMDKLGLKLKFAQAEPAWAGWIEPGNDRPLFLIGRPYDGGPASAGNGAMIALLASSRAMVDQAYAVALEHGATCEGAPGLRPHYHANYYGAYFRDLDGNKLALCCHTAAN